MKTEQDGRLYLTLLQKVLIKFKDNTNISQQAINLNLPYTGVFNLIKQVMFPLDLVEYVEGSNRINLTAKGKALKSLLDRYEKLLEV